MADKLRKFQIGFVPLWENQILGTGWCTSTEFDLARECKTRNPSLKYKAIPVFIEIGEENITPVDMRKSSSVPQKSPPPKS